MRKVTILLSISLLVTPILLSMGVTYSEYDPSHTIDGYTSVYDDLLALDTNNLDEYRLNLHEDPKVLNFVEDKEGYLYCYIYRVGLSQTFDCIDLSTKTNTDDKDFADEFTRYYMTEISSEDYLVKYQVQNLQGNLNVNRRYAIRQVYNTVNKSNIGDILGVSLEYTIRKDDEGNWKSQLNLMDSIVLEGKTMFQLYNMGWNNVDNDNKYEFSQRYYRAFNTSYNLEDIYRIDMTYKFQSFTGLTNVGFDMSDINCDKFARDMTNSNQIVRIDGVALEEKMNVSIYPDSVSYEATLPWWSKKVKYSYKTIQKTSSINNLNEALSDYEWVVTFKDTIVKTRESIEGLGRVYYYVYDFIEVNEATILTMRARVNGEIKELVVIDTYSPSEGNQPIAPGEISEWYQFIIDAWKAVISNKADVLDWVVVILSSIIGLIVLGLVIKILSIVIGIFKILALPFRRKI